MVTSDSFGKGFLGLGKKSKQYLLLKALYRKVNNLGVSAACIVLIESIFKAFLYAVTKLTFFST